MPDQPEDVIDRCPICQVAIRRNHPYAWCSNCGNTLPDDLQARLRIPKPSAVVRAEADAPLPDGPQVKFQRFTSSFLSWESLFAEAGAFATRVGRERLISISHSEDHSKGVVTVWYWSE